jgi:hypothetical protein
MKKRWLFGALYLTVAAVALANSGCIGLAIGAAAGVGAAGYAVYMRGQWYRDYPATLDDTAAAVKAALAELQLPMDAEKRDTDVITFESHTKDNTEIHIELKAAEGKLPADGPTTHISIRVGNLGDEELSRRILDQVSLHVVAPVQVRPQVNTSALPPSGTLPPAPPQTREPPVAK